MLNHQEYREQKRKLIFEEGTQVHITTEEIAQFEKENKIKIPDQYRDFLIKNNGVRVDPNNSYLTSEQQGEYLGILGFVELQNAEVGKNEDNFDEESGTVKPPKGLMTLTYMEDCPHTEMFICIEKGKNYGKIYYCEDRQNEWKTLVSNSFDEFINGTLTTFNYEWEEVCKYGLLKQAEYLINKGYNVTEPGFNLIGEALKSEFNMDEAILKIIERVDNIKGLLCFAAYRNNLKIVKALHQQGCDINERSNYNDYLIRMSDTPLLASIRGIASPELIEYLLENGADPKIRNLEEKDSLRAINSQNTGKKGNKWKEEIKNLIIKYYND